MDFLKQPENYYIHPEISRQNVGLPWSLLFSWCF